MPVERWQFPIGPVGPDHPALACPECEGEGGWLEQLPAGCADLEPRYKEVRCETCEGGYLYELECSECGLPLLPARDGVGALVEIEAHRPLHPGKPEGPCVRSVRWLVLCGPCAWTEVVAG